MSKPLSTKTEEAELFSAEQLGDITTLRFVHDDLVGVDLERMKPLWGFLSGQTERPAKVLLIDISSGLLSPENVDRLLRELLRSRKGLGDNYALRQDLTREENALNLLAEKLSSLDSFVVVLLRGDIDLPFLGVALSCDYRIASDSAVFTNRLLDGGLPPCGGLHWYMSRFLSLGVASHVLTTGRSVPASQAHQLGLVDDVFPLDELAERATEVAEWFAGKPRSRLVAMKHLLQATQGSRDRYLAVEERELNRCIASIAESTEGRAS